MKRFQDSFQEYTAQKNAWGYNGKDIEFSNELMRQLSTRMIDPNIYVVDKKYPEYSGPLLACILSGRIHYDGEIARKLIDLGADANSIAEEYLTPNSPKAVSALRNNSALAIITTGGISNLERYLNTLIAMPDYRDFTSLNLEKVLVDLVLLNHNVVERDNQGNSALYYAAKSGNLKMACLLLCADADANMQNNDGETPLFATVRFGNHSIEEMLLFCRADPTIQNHNGETADAYRNQSRFLEAIKGKSVKTAEKMLNLGVSPDCMFANGRTALQVACKAGDLPMVRLLLEYHANLELRGERGIWDFPPVSIAFDNVIGRRRGGESPTATPNELFELFEVMVNAGADVDVSPCGYGGVTLLEAVCTWGGNSLKYAMPTHSLKSLELLLKAPNSRKREAILKGRRASLIRQSIAKEKSEDFILRLLDEYESIDSEDDSVAAAIKFNFQDVVVKKLLEKSANPNVPFRENLYSNSASGNKQDLTALELAKRSNRQRTIKLLKQYGAE